MTKVQLRGVAWFGIGLLFSVLWSSASAATKIGLRSAQPFTICVIRFFIAGPLMLGIAHGLLRNRLPSGREWKQLAIYGALNISIYLGLYVVAMQQVSPGLGSLATATSPVFINLITGWVFQQRLRAPVYISLVLCSAGVVLAAWPLLRNSSATPQGLLILLLSMLSYSAGVIYFSRQAWNNLPVLVINGWQTLMGGVFILPVALLTYHRGANMLDSGFWGAVLWLAIPVSIAAVQLWLYLLRENATRASFWLFLTPVSGFVIANLFMHEQVGLYTLTGMILVIIGLYLVQRNKVAG